MKRPLSLLGAACLLAVSAGAQQTLKLEMPSRASPGAVVSLVVKSPAGRDSIVAIEGTMSGEPLHFHSSALRQWHSIGPVSADAKVEATAIAFVSRASGRVDTLRATTKIPATPASHGRPPALSVSTRFTQPLDSATQARIDRENATAREIGRKSHENPPLWTAPFHRPRSSKVTSPFGSGRLFNGKLTSRHLGVDFRGKTGDPIVAANRGVVALVDDFFLAGNVVYIDHGAGIVTAYFHVSKTLVAKGDTVERGQAIGLIGATGRVTGPHLHWSARYGTLTVNPLDLVALGSSW
ncbi:MAG: M23 family metallopeptidase [Gemmatimonadaceae bacterium]